MSSRQKQEEMRFREHVRRLSVRNFPSNSDGFDDELTELGKIDQRVRSNLDEFYTASLGSSMSKNRFDDVKPNEQTIVRLRPVSRRGDGTYINANYIDARRTMGVPFVYIATQAPMQNTVLDFWRMVYENDVAFIVMLCATKENGKGKSETYWPAQGQVYDLGLLSVTTITENARSDSVHRTMLLRTIRGDEKEVYHMQYLAWPDQGIPMTSIPLMEMIQAIGKSRRSVESPIVVHCSGGIGRTGVFIGLHIALAQFQLEQSGISLMRIVRFMKLCRSGMVQRKDQYMFLYYSIQREMERMILSAERGVNLLDIRHRDRPLSSETQSGELPQSSLAHRSSSVLPIPDPNRTVWSSATINNLLRSTGPESRRQPPQVNRTAGHRWVDDGGRKSRQNRDVVTDMTAMENYLRRNPSMRSASAGWVTHSVPRGAKSYHKAEKMKNKDKSKWSPFRRRGGRDTSRSRREAHNDSANISERLSPRDDVDSSERQAHQRRPVPAQGRPPSDDTAARATLEAELLRIQSINRQLRFASDDGQGESQQGPMEATPARAPMSIKRESRSRSGMNSPRVVLTARERVSAGGEDDMTYLQRRFITQAELREL